MSPLPPSGRQPENRQKAGSLHIHKIMSAKPCKTAGSFSCCFGSLADFFNSN